MSQQGLNIEVAVPYGEAAESILLEIGMRSADLVIMCTQLERIAGWGQPIKKGAGEMMTAESGLPR